MADDRLLDLRLVPDPSAKPADFRIRAPPWAHMPMEPSPAMGTIMPVAMRKRRHRTCVAAHEEWLLDEAIMETFPASDPTSPYRSEGSTAAEGTAYRSSASISRARRRDRRTLWWIIAGCAVFYLAYVARRRRR